MGLEAWGLRHWATVCRALASPHTRPSPSTKEKQGGLGKHSWKQGGQMKGSQTDAQTQASSRKARRRERQVPEGRAGRVPHSSSGPRQVRASINLQPHLPSRTEIPLRRKLDWSSGRTRLSREPSQEHTRVLSRNSTPWRPQPADCWTCSPVPQSLRHS